MSDISTKTNISVNPEFLSDYSERDARWDKKRSQCQDVEGLYALKPEYERLSDRMQDCSGALTFGWTDDPETGESRLKLVGTKFCHVRHCPVCQWRRSLKNIARFLTKLPEIRQQYPTYRFLFLTLTVQNPKYEDLRDTIKAMNKGWARLIERKEWPAKGWIRTTEVTNEQKRKGYAHPHFHVLMMVPSNYFAKGYIKQERWLELWQEAMRDPAITQVDVRAVKPGDDLNEAVQETLKYSMKVEDGLQDPDFLYCLTSQLHKTRFLASGGVFKDILKESMTDQEMIEGDDPQEGETTGNISFKWRRSARRYIRNT